MRRALVTRNGNVVATACAPIVALVALACCPSISGCSSDGVPDSASNDADDLRHRHNASDAQADAGLADAPSTDAAASDAISPPPPGDGGTSDSGTVSVTDCTVTRCHYVRSGATGAQDGTDWNNAYSSLPATLVRGDTYFVAGGNYPPHTFEDPESGSAVITIKKATVADHGTNTGWQAAYGSAQAIFASILTFNTGNYVLDGQTRNEGNWFDAASYGIQVNHNGTLNQNIVIGPNGGPAANNITIQYVYIEAPYQNLPTTQTIRQYAVDTDTFGGPQHTGLVFRRMYVRGSNNVWFLRSTTGALVEYSASYGAVSNGANHGEVVNLYYTGIDATIRFNRFKEEYIGNGGTALVAITDGGDSTPGAGTGLQFYGNVADHFQVGDAAVGFDGSAKGFSTSHTRVYNNTFINSVGYNAGTACGYGTDNITYNNLYINCNTVWFDGDHDYNAYSSSDAHGEAHAQTSLASTIFVDSQNGDYRLTGATAPGFVLQAPYDRDMLGVLRGHDGSWDRGAFEY